MQNGRNHLIQRIRQFIAGATNDAQFISLLESQPTETLQQFFSCSPLNKLESLNLDSNLVIYSDISEPLLFGIDSLDIESLVLFPPMEIRLVYYGLRPVALIQGQEEELGLLLRYAENMGMVGLLSSYEWYPINDLGKGGYSNLTGERKPAQAGSNAFRTLLISQDIDNVCLAWLALSYSWDDVLGQLLNYPSCCTKAFEKRWPEAIEFFQGDLASLIYKDSKPPPFDWRLNIFGRYFGFELIQHFPCSFNCQASLQQAIKTERVLDQFEPQLMGKVRDELQSPVLFSHLLGVVILHQASIKKMNKGLYVEYDPQLLEYTDLQSTLNHALSSTNRLDYLSQDNKILIGTESFDGFIVTFEALLV